MEILSALGNHHEMQRSSYFPNASPNLKSIIMNTTSIEESYAVCLPAVTEGGYSNKRIVRRSSFEDFDESVAQFCAQSNFHRSAPARTCPHGACVGCGILSRIPEDPIGDRVSCRRVWHTTVGTENILARIILDKQTARSKDQA